MFGILEQAIVLALLIRTVLSAPYEAYSVDSQIPPVARIQEQFSFQLSNDTYKSSLGHAEISYKAYELPTWLSFDSSSRILSGVPPEGTIGGDDDLLYFQFVLEGTDPVDSVSLNTTAQLVVSSKTSVELAQDFNLLALLRNYGSTNGKDGLIIQPNEVFNVTFDRSAYTQNSSITAFYGRSKQYHSPLPNWLFFDPNVLKFSGAAPVVNSNIAPQLSYEFVLIATDVDGYSGVEIPFSLVVGAHALTTSVQNDLIINVTDTRTFDYEVPLDYVYLDGNFVKEEDISSVNLLNAPSWVTLNNFTISGTVPSESDLASSNNFSLSIYDVYGDVIYFNFEVMSTTNLFAVSSLSNLNATRGDYFQYNFLPSQFTDYDQTNVTVEFTNSSQDYQWLRYHEANLTLFGIVPDAFDALSLNLIAQEGAVTQVLPFSIIGTESKSINTTNTTNTTTTSSSLSSMSSLTSSSSSMLITSSAITTVTSMTASSTSMAASSSAAIAPLVKHTGGSSNKGTAIGCGVGISLGVIVVAVLVYLFWYRKKRQNSKSDLEKEPETDGPAVKPYGHEHDTDATINPFNDAEGSYYNAGGAKLEDDLSSASSSSTVEEKLAEKNTNALYSNNNHTPSSEFLLGKPETTGVHDVRNTKSSSLYLNSEPANRKSWRYNQNTGYDHNVRGSMMTLNTVSTEEFLNTEIQEEGQITKDPRKSTLGLRDSVFGNKSTARSSKFSTLDNNSRVNLLPSLDEKSQMTGETSDNFMSASSSDDFIPVQEDGKYNWVQRNSPSRKASQKKLVNLNENNDIGVQNVVDIEGQVPEEL